MNNIVKSIKMAAAGLLAIAGISSVAVADILLVDDERVEREAAAYKDFNLQTTQIRESILALRNDAYQAEFATKEAEFQAEGANLQRGYQNETEQLQRLELVFDRLRQEAQTQVERARQPVIRNILKVREAKIIMRKRLVMGSASGLDVTTEFIEQLDAELPSVTLALLQQQNQAPAEGETPPAN